MIVPIAIMAAKECGKRVRQSARKSDIGVNLANRELGH
jgi:hypothetical protein